MATLRNSGPTSTPVIVAVQCTDHENEKDSSRDAGKLADVKPKKKCCRIKPRRKRCPVAIHEVHKAKLNGIRGKELTKVFKRARKS